MRNLILATVAFTILGGPAALASDEFIKGVYLESEALCAQAKSDTLQTVIEAGNVVLTARGLDSIEYNCEFLQVTRATRSPAWLVNALCQEPGHLFPDVLSVLEMSPTQLDLVSVKPADPDGGGSNSGSYFLCDGVTMP